MAQKFRTTNKKLFLSLNLIASMVEKNIIFNFIYQFFLLDVSLKPMFKFPVSCHLKVMLFSATICFNFDLYPKN